MPHGVVKLDVRLISFAKHYLHPYDCNPSSHDTSRLRHLQHLAATEYASILRPPGFLGSLGAVFALLAKSECTPFQFAERQKRGRIRASEACKVKVSWFTLAMRFDVCHDDTKFFMTSSPSPPRDPNPGFATEDRNYFLEGELNDNYLQRYHYFCWLYVVCGMRGK
ncbi:hypothetical protein AVEN_65213-1 [Araneus ventricosus]|uniref:Uncharacterized protein n=1 Tax=Araneus ventricosus TaxID=182803 RepID=A0A4Y2AFK5_ARAVE|nr:hypothetical protein AVEN_65213-1 [Araneus ventricosus]